MHRLPLFILTLLLAGCAVIDDPFTHELLRPPRDKPVENDERAVPDKREAGESLEQDGASDITPPTSPRRNVPQRAQPADALPQLPDGSFGGSFDGLTVATFINEVLGEELGLNFRISEPVREKRDLITLRVVDPISAAAFYRLAEDVLADYGVALRPGDDVIEAVTAGGGNTIDPPIFITGEALPEVPASHRPHFAIYPMKVANANSTRGLLNQAFRNAELEVGMVPSANALLLRGRTREVGQALRTLEILDQPGRKSQNIAVFVPDSSRPSELAQPLRDTLQAQGYHLASSLGQGALEVLAFDDLGKLVLLAEDGKTLTYMREWARTLDNQSRLAVSDGVFSYEVQNQQAQALADLANQLFGVGGQRRGASSETGGANRRAGSDSSQASPSDGERGNVPGGNRTSGAFVVDHNRNVLLFRGSGEQWGKILPQLRKMDKPVPSVLVEILIAEVTINEDYGGGVNWVLENENLGRFGLSYGTRSGIDLSGTGFALTLDSAGAVRAMVNAFVQDQRAVIRSTPRIMVKSGESARIEVGDEVPFITSRFASETQTDGTSDVVQQIEFRDTGVQLNVTPIVQAGGLVDIVIEQELSEAQGSANALAPTFLNRSLTTSLSLRDGGSVVIGGLISESSSDDATGVPWLSDIPLLGWLFKNQSRNSQRTELMVMIVPYVVRNADEADGISRALRQQLGRNEAE